jgi:hypothetical protein
VLRAGSVPSSPHNFVVLETKAHLGPNLGLGSASLGLKTMSFESKSMGMFFYLGGRGRGQYYGIIENKQWLFFHLQNMNIYIYIYIYVVLIIKKPCGFINYSTI